MSRGQTLRALVNERLAAAAEDIFVLFERAIAEYEEQLCRLKKDMKKQELLDKVLVPRPELVNMQIPWTSPGPSLNQEITEAPRIKEEPEEQSIKQEEEQLPVSFPNSNAVCVKNEESSMLQENHIGHREKMQGEDISSEPHFYSVIVGHAEHSPDTDKNDDSEPFSCPTAQMETEANRNYYNKVENKSTPEITVHSGHMPGAYGGGAERKKHQCSFCNKGFDRKRSLKIHIRVHTGEKPYSCSICEKAFAKKDYLDSHKRTHTGEKPYSCSTCGQRFAYLSSLKQHTKSHTGERPYSCPSCEKTFSTKGNLDSHNRTHTGEKPYSCSKCAKSFAHHATLRKHSVRKHFAESVNEITIKQITKNQGFVQQSDNQGNEYIQN